jgi:hypothetical protein
MTEDRVATDDDYDVVAGMTPSEAEEAIETAERATGRSARDVLAHMRRDCAVFERAVQLVEDLRANGRATHYRTPHRRRARHYSRML